MIQLPCKVERDDGSGQLWRRYDGVLDKNTEEYLPRSVDIHTQKQISQMIRKTKTFGGVTVCISIGHYIRAKASQVWKWFQVLGGHSLDSLHLTDYSFIQTALEN